ncbi:hypothetical protein GGF37_004449, partial [Kickxella alabastrina]
MLPGNAPDNQPTAIPGRRRSVGDLKQLAAPAPAPAAMAMAMATAPSASSSSSIATTTATATSDHWLNEELEAVGELKRGAIAAQFPEEFSIDPLDAPNVWLPARLHPEIAPGEFQEWLSKHGSQLSKMEDTVNRRKSILSYSYKSVEEPLVADARRDFGSGAVRRRNTTGLVRRKSFVERVEEDVAGDGEFGVEAPFLVQSVQRSSLKRSKLANKRRDSTASTGLGRRGRGGRVGTGGSAPGVSSPLVAPMDQETSPKRGSDDEFVDVPAPVPVPASRPESSLAAGAAAADSADAYGAELDLTPSPVPVGVLAGARVKRLSTAEILKQVTAAVDDFGFDDFDICEAEPMGNTLALAQVPTAPPPSIPMTPPAPVPAPAAASSAVASSASSSDLAERKTISHKKSASWWQWGGRDEGSGEGGDSGKSTPPQQQQQQQQGLPMSLSRGRMSESPAPPVPPVPAVVPSPAAVVESSPPLSLSKNKLPSPISFLRFNRKSKKERRLTDEHQVQTTPPVPQQQQHQQQYQPDNSKSVDSSNQFSVRQTPSSGQSQKQPQSQQQQQQQQQRADTDSDVSSDNESQRPKQQHIP